MSVFLDGLQTTHQNRELGQRTPSEPTHSCEKRSESLNSTCLAVRHELKPWFLQPLTHKKPQEYQLFHGSDSKLILQRYFWNWQKIHKNFADRKLLQRSKCSSILQLCPLRKSLNKSPRWFKELKQQQKSIIHGNVFIHWYSSNN